MKPSLLALALLVAAPAAAQHQHQHQPQSQPQPGIAPPSTTSRLGDIDFPNSGAAAAQADFISGVKQLHNFEYDGAIAAFRRAQQDDPSMVLAYWGEAMANNQTLWSVQHRDAALAVLAKLGASPAERAAKAKTRREGLYLAAVEALYGNGTKARRDAAYERAMARLAAAYPRDVEAQTFGALAILGLTNGTRNTANYERAGARLEKLFPAHKTHPGVVHYLIHSYDDPDHAERGLAAARLYDRIAPDSPHALHMTSHIFLARGMWPEVESANLRAGAVAGARFNMPKQAVFCGHGGIWLAYARLQQGKDIAPQLADCRLARQAMIDRAAGQEKPLAVSGEYEHEASASVLRVMRGVESGQWAPRQPLPEGRLLMAGFIDDYGDVLAARDHPAAAATALAAARLALAAVRAAHPAESPDDDQTLPWLDLMLAEAEAGALLADGRQAEGLAALRAVAQREKAMPPVFGPPVLTKPSWELLGDELLRAGNRPEAARAYAQSLRLQPGRRLSQQGLRAASR